MVIQLGSMETKLGVISREDTPISEPMWLTKQGTPSRKKFVVFLSSDLDTFVKIIFRVKLIIPCQAKYEK